MKRESQSRCTSRSDEKEAWDKLWIKDRVLSGSFMLAPMVPCGCSEILSLKWDVLLILKGNAYIIKIVSYNIKILMIEYISAFFSIPEGRTPLSCASADW